MAGLAISYQSSSSLLSSIEGCEELGLWECIMDTSLDHSSDSPTDIVRFIPPGLQRDEIVIDIFSDNLFNEGVEVAGLDFVNSANRPAYLQGAYPITRLVIFDRSK